MNNSLQNSSQQLYVTENNKQDSFLLRFRPGKFVVFFSFLLIIAVIPLALHLLSQPTNIPIHASNGTTLSITGNYNYGIGQHVNLDITLDPAGKAISSAKIVILYNPHKLKPITDSLIPNLSAFPIIIQGPIYNQCNNNTCSITMVFSIGSNPTNVITTVKKVATINFTALEKTDSDGTIVGFDPTTEIFSVSDTVSAQKNILATTNPATIIINATSPTPGPTITLNPTFTPTPKPTNTPVLTPTPTNSAPLTTTLTPLPAGGISDTFLSIALKLDLPHDILTGAVTTPQHPIRQATIYLYKLDVNPHDTNIQPLKMTTDSLTYDANSQVFINHHFAIGKVPTGTYQLLIKTNQYLRKLVSQSITIQNGQITSVGTIQLIGGDIMPQTTNNLYGDNILDMNDYNLLTACFGANITFSNCINKNAADLDDDGKVDGTDLNLMLRNIATIMGSSGSSAITPKVIIPQPTDTKLALTIFLDGIGKAGDRTKRGNLGNMSPIHKNRPILIAVSDSFDNPITTVMGTVIYDTNQGAFVGTVDIGNLTTGKYNIRITTSQFLAELVPNLQQIIGNQLNPLNPIYLIAGNITGHNSIDVTDYKILANCYSGNTTPCTDSQRTAADLNDDGEVNLSDYNLFIRELNIHFGD